MQSKRIPPSSPQHSDTVHNPQSTKRQIEQSQAKVERTEYTLKSTLDKIRSGTLRFDLNDLPSPSSISNEEAFFAVYLYALEMPGILEGQSGIKVFLERLFPDNEDKQFSSAYIALEAIGQRYGQDGVDSFLAGATEIDHFSGPHLGLQLYSLIAGWSRKAPREALDWYQRFSKTKSEPARELLSLHIADDALATSFIARYGFEGASSQLASIPLDPELEADLQKQVFASMWDVESMSPLNWLEEHMQEPYTEALLFEAIEQSQGTPARLGDWLMEHPANSTQAKALEHFIDRWERNNATSLKGWLNNSNSAKSLVEKAKGPEWLNSLLADPSVSAPK